MKKRVCSKCNKILADTVKFCKYCGGEAIDKSIDEIPAERRVSAMIYGPPYSEKHVCHNCGKVFIEHGLGSPSARYCVECGAKYDN